MSTNQERNYPDVGLNLITRDPLVRWGCSYAEIMQSVGKGVIASLFPIVIFIALTPFSGMIKFGFSFLLCLIVTAAVARYLCYKIAKTRADKPPFYDKHLVFKKTGAFIKPNINYQRERNLK